MNRKRSKVYKVGHQTSGDDVECAGELPVTPPAKFLGDGPELRTDTMAMEYEQQRETQLSVFEKKYLLCAERGDVPAVRSLLVKHKTNPRFNINCRDALGRTALVVAIENENMELIELVLQEGIEPGDALLHAISEEYVEAVEVLLKHEEKIFAPGRPYSWESVDTEMANFTKDITPLILASHRDNYEVIKLLLDRGATLPMPHDVRCGCDQCVKATKQDCLRHSRSRINAYRALSSPSLICLSSTDPILTAFTLSSELRSLSYAENEFKSDYTELRRICQEYATAVLDHTRTSYELEVLLNYDPKGPMYVHGERMKLERLKLAIASKQKTFVAHPNVQQLLASVWYEGSPGFRRKGTFGQFLEISRIGMMFPLYSVAYMVAPGSALGQTMKKPFTKFICHSASYCFFLMLLILASQKVETILMKLIGTEYLKEKVRLDHEQERGKPPGFVESAIVIYVIGFVWSEIKQLWSSGLDDYLSDMWNIVDFFTNMLYLTSIGLRFSAWYIVRRELASGIDAFQPREKWDPYDPMLISEGIFGAANIFSFLKMVHIFSVNPHLGPLQISLGRMVFDIIKFFFIYSLVLFAFGCGMNQLLWYYADIDKDLCYSGPNGSENPDHQDSCNIWRRFANLFETSQSLFWASFGLVELDVFELTGIKSYTRFWSLLMYGSYSVINVVVLLNLLIAMMSSSYQIISERSDVEWKFARSKLWMSYFEDGSTVPPPFNIFPTPKLGKRFFGCQFKPTSSSVKVKEEFERDARYRDVMRCLVRRYVTTQQRKAEETGVTEDDVCEVKQAVNSFRSELFEVLRNNGMKCASHTTETLSRKERLRERRLLKDFNIDLVETVMEALMKDKEGKSSKFDLLRRVTLGKRNARRNWNAVVQATRSRQNHIGSSSSVLSGSLADLREQVFQEQEIKPVTGRRKFVSIAWRAREMDKMLSRSQPGVQYTVLENSNSMTSLASPGDASIGQSSNNYEEDNSETEIEFHSKDSNARLRKVSEELPFENGDKTLVNTETKPLAVYKSKSSRSANTIEDSTTTSPASSYRLRKLSSSPVNTVRTTSNYPISVVSKDQTITSNTSVLSPGNSESVSYDVSSTHLGELPGDNGCVSINLGCPTERYSSISQSSELENSELNIPTRSGPCVKTLRYKFDKPFEEETIASKQATELEEKLCMEDYKIDGKPGNIKIEIEEQKQGNTSQMSSTDGKPKMGIPTEKTTGEWLSPSSNWL